MSKKLIDHNPDLHQLQSEGYEIRCRENFLLVSSVPYINQEGQLKYGKLACDLEHINNVVKPPAAHPAWWQGEYPCYTDGTAIEAIRNPSPGKTLLTGFDVDYYFSARPYDADGQPGNYANFYDKITTYIAIISAPALQRYPDAVVKTDRVFIDEADDLPFLYPDTNSSRAEINAIADKLKGLKIGIIGLGGTGSYILDLVAKTSVSEIHLFDSDLFSQHNAFRSPGAASEADIDRKLKKVDYLSSIYSHMRRGIVPHSVRITMDNLGLLASLSYVFVAIDKSAIKRPLFNFLVEKGIPFIDVGIGVDRHNNSLMATARITAATADFNRHLPERVSLADDDLAHDEYDSNIQIAEINAINAAMAVIHWKRHYSFYEKTSSSMHAQMAVEDLKIFTSDYQP